MSANNQDMLAHLGTVHIQLQRARTRLQSGLYWTARVKLGQTFGENIELRPFEDHVTVGSSITLIERLEQAQNALGAITSCVMMGDIEGALELIDKELP